MLDILEASGVGLPDYYKWRSRSGCTFCFFQQKIEWVRLREEHPEAYEDAKLYEKNAVEHGSPFTWSQGESLIELAQPERIQQIREDHARAHDPAERQAADQSTPARRVNHLISMSCTARPKSVWPATNERQLPNGLAGVSGKLRYLMFLG